MENRVENIIQQIKSIIDFDVMRRLFFLGGIALSVAIGLGIHQWTQEPLYSPLDFRMSDKNFPTVVETLEKANIKYKLNEASGLISVPATDVNMARIRLTSAGLLNAAPVNYAFLNDKNKLGSSQFLENTRYLRALEEDLAKTIGSIQGISSAIVHIAKPQSNIFANENAKTTASIIINTTPGYDGDKEKVRAIIQLVAASVPELDPTNVAITDQYGHYLTSVTNTDYLHNQEQLTYQTNLENNYEKRIQSLIFPLLGRNKASINVNADVDFTQQEEAKEAYDPSQNAVRSEQTVKEDNTSSSPSGVPGSLANQPPSTGQQQPTASSGQSRSESVKNYELGKSTTYVKTDTPKIKRISVAVVLDNERVYDKKSKKMLSKPIDKEKLDKITELVKSSIGYNQSRGDMVTVINSGFIETKAEPDRGVAMWDEPWFWDLVKKSTGIILGFVFLFIIYRKISPELVRKKDSAQALSLEATEKQNLISAEMMRLKNEQIEILKELVQKDPNKVVGVIKKWVAK
ncbi:flagellar basal-body MS-ring/collar protein FliF [Legionella sp. CNM-4043-24]|uniref:flagellar basal-body MS-ring/collar protein FliF n=1 Tax=Legionella sp. CNM-4043-24 TaxID=3421646 RepID=UPI00403B2C44